MKLPQVCVLTAVLVCSLRLRSFFSAQLDHNYGGRSLRKERHMWTPRLSVRLCDRLSDFHKILYRGYVKEVVEQAQFF
jgi:hypothetical protein